MPTEFSVEKQNPEESYTSCQLYCAGVAGGCFNTVLCYYNQKVLNPQGS